MMNSGKVLRRIAAGVGVAALASGLMLAAAPAQAANTLKVKASCGVNGTSVTCTAVASNGVPPYQYVWSLPDWPSGDTIGFTCATNGAISVTATDALGNTGTATAGYTCR